MEVFVMKILTSLLIIALVTSSVVTERLHIENNGNSIRTLDTENRTKEDCNQDATGIQRVISYDYRSPNKPCYRQFFVGELPPSHLRDINNVDIRYICQPPTPQPPAQQAQQTYYATMFDESRGIAVFSAYTLTQPSQARVSARRPHPWCRTPGIRRQGSEAIYRTVQYQKGHLVPSATFSNTQERYDSTYTYTNAVPQRSTFNGGSWSQAERRIRKYAKDTCTKPLRSQPGRRRQRPGRLYLLTGTSFARIRLHHNHPQANVHVADNQIGGQVTGPIKIPNSLWTAGCCVRQNGQFTRSFAVIGNNVETGHQASLTRQVTVAQLQNILTADVNHFQLNNNIGGHNVVLFHDQDCWNNDLGQLPN